MRDFDRRRAGLVVWSFLPPALVGYRFERSIEERLGTPATIAAGLVAGSAAMALVDRRPGTRSREEAGAVDGLALGLAQACSLVPGVSRNGATLVAARARGFGRTDANTLSRHVALPVILGAGAFKALRMRRRAMGGGARSLPTGATSALAVGAAAAFVSTLASSWLIRHVERARSLMPYAAYRGALAGLVIWRLRQNGRSDGTHR
jgi:undecaprenyl-diphosphatase